MFFVRVISGLVLIILALHEVYRDLFQISSQGTLSKRIARLVFNSIKRFPSLLPSAGPFSYFLVIGCWVSVIVCGFALVYWAFFPDAFQVSVAGGQHPAHVFVTLLYLSLEMLTTLGLGEFIPRTQPVRFVMVGEALVGVLLFSASISWFVLLYPALASLRKLAKHVYILCEAAKKGGRSFASVASESLLSDFAVSVTEITINFVQYPIIYYFDGGANYPSLPQALLHLQDLADASANERNPEAVRVAAAGLQTALGELAQLFAAKFLHTDGSDPVTTFRAYAEDHASQTTPVCDGESADEKKKQVQKGG